MPSSSPRGVEVARRFALKTEQNAADERHQRGLAGFVGASEQHNALVAVIPAPNHNAPVMEHSESIKVDFAYAHGLRISLPEEQVERKRFSLRNDLQYLLIVKLANQPRQAATRPTAQPLLERPPNCRQTGRVGSRLVR